MSTWDDIRARRFVDSNRAIRWINSTTSVDPPRVQPRYNYAPTKMIQLSPRRFASSDTHNVVQRTYFRVRFRVTFRLDTDDGRRRRVWTFHFFAVGDRGAAPNSPIWRPSWKMAETSRTAAVRLQCFFFAFAFFDMISGRCSLAGWRWRRWRRLEEEEEEVWR